MPPFSATLIKAGDHPAILTGTGCLTYAEVDARAGALAHRVRSAGVRPGRVAVVGERGADYHVGYLGALYSGAAVVPLREPDSVDVKVRVQAGIRPSHVQTILDEQVRTPTRSAATVLLEEIDGDELVIRVQATPERASDGAALADEIIAALGAVTKEHALDSEYGGDGA